MADVTRGGLARGERGDAGGGIVGRPACPRGLRHGFGVGTLQASVPLNMVQKWMGHARMSTTAIYADASGDEEAALAARFWDDGEYRELSFISVAAAAQPGGKKPEGGTRRP